MSTVVRGHRRGREWTRVAHGLHVRSRQPLLRDRLGAWILVLPETAVLTSLTAAAVRGAGVAPTVEATEYTVAGLVDALASWARDRRASC